MPALVDYVRLEPFTLDELVQAVNSVVRKWPSMSVTTRTMRYYVSKGLLKGPNGPPKLARYDAEHLTRTVGLRFLVERGHGLDAAGAVLDELYEDAPERAVERVQAWLDGSERPPTNANRVLSQRLFSRELPAIQQERLVRRIQLTPNAVLELDANAQLGRDGQQILEALRKILK